MTSPRSRNDRVAPRTGVPGRPRSGPAAALLLVVAMLGTAPGVHGSDESPGDAAAASAAAIESHVRYLASDDLRGRDTGTAGSLLAAEYIAGVFEAAGLQPAGDDDTYYQELGATGHQLTSAPTVVLTGDGQESYEAVYSTDFRLMGAGAPVDDAPLHVLTDIEGLQDLEVGAGVALLLDLPDFREAMGLVMENSAELADFAALVMLPAPWMRDRPPPIHALLRPEEPATLMVRGELLARVRAGEPDRLRFGLETAEPVRAVNVVGLLPGVGTEARPELADEVVVFTAHYDHVGERRPDPDEPDADLIYNGANDDASGVSFVLELARAFAAGPPPARSLLFMAVTGEEKGFVGSTHFVDHPTVPLERLVADLNFEMVGVPDGVIQESGTLFITGADRSNLAAAWIEADLAIVADPHPQMNLFMRSDNYPFARRGIVAQSLSSGGEVDHYHEVTDHWDTLDYAHMAASLEAALAASRMLATGELDPAWLPGKDPSGP